MPYTNLRDAAEAVGVDPADAGLPSAAGLHFASRRDTGPTWTVGDLTQAHAEVVARLAGQRVAPDSRHPLAADLLRDGRAPRLTDLLTDYLAATHGAEVYNWDTRTVLAAGTAHLSNVLKDVADNQVIARAPRLLEKALRLTKAVECKDYRPAEIAVLELDVAPNAPTVRLREWETLTPTGSAESLQLRTAPLRLRFSEQLTVNDDIGAIAATVDAVVAACAQRELALLFALVNDGVTMSDGAALFSTAASTLVESGSRDAATLDLAVSALRSQTYGDQYADADPALLVVPASDEVVARQVVAAASGGNAEWLEVVASRYMDEEAWLLLADPEVWPMFARGTARNAEGRSLRFSQGSPRPTEGLRDTIIEALHTVDYAAVSRVGGVKVTMA